ncbi:MAG: hypothetical protein U5K76_04750 [Woeseiaceae bacterium]|nr:hypothetical protein [Woeseiaceae bacterium]
MLWVIFGAMLLAGALFVCWPLYRHDRRLTPGLALGAIAVLALSGALYQQIGSPGAPSGPGQAATVEAMVESLAARLEAQPDDVDGWRMLGRSYVQLQQFSRAIGAFEQALERGAEDDAQTLADLGEAVLLNDERAIRGRAGQLFESALAASPQNQKALFYGGLAALQRNNRDLAAERWETLLATSPPPEVAEVLRARIAEWRGEAPPAPAAAGGGQGGRAIAVDIRLGDAARADVSPTTTVFVIARDPAQPSPPVAATRIRAAELPATVTLSDDDSMIPGRTLSQFDTLEIVVRASLSGQPVARPGDWYGQAQSDSAGSGDVAVVIDRRVD